MESFKIFVVFHKSIHEKCYEELDPDEFSHLVFVAVNENLPKTYPTDTKYNIIKEWELPIYDPELQKNGFCENTVIRHVYLNKLYGNATHVGFCQYDAYFKKGSINSVKQTMTPNSIHAMIMCGWSLYESNFPNHFLIDRVIKNMYEYFPNVQFSKNTVFAMCNTFVLPVSVLDTIMPWIIQLDPVIWPASVKPPERCDHWRMPACYLEHVMGMVLSSLYREFYQWPGIIHPTTHGVMQELRYENDPLPENWADIIK